MKEYNVGLDIGTGSVGWAIIGNNGQLMKKGNKNLWGANLFDEAESAIKTRMKRSTRRRYLRRKQRINLLRDLMNETINNVDPMFFKKLELSYMVNEDKESEFDSYSSNSYFFDKLMTNKEYGKMYPTIYHLRQDLISCTEKKDPRLIYLALHHMIKYRGNFLYEGQKINLNESEKEFEKMEYIVESLNYIFDDELSNFDYKDYIAKLSKQEARMEIKQKLIDNFKKQNLAKEILSALTELTNAILGYSFTLDKIFLQEDLGKLQFSDENIDSRMDELSTLIGDGFDVLLALQSLYSTFILKRIIGDTTGTISSNMIMSYEKHKSDLRKLKNLIKQNYSSNDYEDMFKIKDIKNSNYYAYINNPGKCKQADIYAKIKKMLKNDVSKLAQEILTEIENNNFLLKQNSTSNGVIPVQLNLEEMDLILENQAKYYTELLENKEKIKKILLFRIPYYVGPLNSNSKWSWIIKKKNEKITPWNFDEVVDKEETAKKFITELTNHCTYLLAEQVMPKNSLLASKYEVLSELNQIKVDGFKLSVEEKKDIVTNLFLKKTKVTKKDIINFLVDRQHRMNINEITGFQKEDEFATNLKSFIDFRNIFGDDYLKHEEDIEIIIEWLTVYNEKDIIKTRINREFPYISNDQVKKILSKNYKGFSRLSKKLLTELIGKDDMGNPVTIIELLEKSTLTLMQIINKSKYKFKELIEDENVLENHDKIAYEDIAKLAGSPAIKRGIWQSVKLVEDFRTYFKCDPKNIFIEFARNDEEKKRSISRNKKIKEIYDKMIKEKIIICGEAITKENRLYKQIDELDLNNTKMLLYIMQNGKSVYSGKSIDINNLDNYDIDHVLPQAYIKDDSIDNKVLVLLGENREKSDDLLIKPEIINKMKFFWQQLLNAGLMSKKKYFNLTRATISDNERVGFVNKQLVETRQIIKHVAHLFSNTYDSNVFSVKASLGSEFRDKYNLYKIRNLNKTHHAHDAYLCARIGLFIINRYPNISLVNEIGTYNKIGSEIASRIKDSLQNVGRNKSLSSFIIRQMGNNDIIDKNTGELVWNGSYELEYIKKIINYKDYFLTYKTDNGGGKFYDETIQNVNIIHKSSIVFPLKKNRNPNIYGGYTSSKPAYGIVVKYSKGKKMGKQLISVPMIFSKDDRSLRKYILQQYEYDDFTILKRIPLGLPIIMNGTRFTLNSMNELRVVEQIFLSESDREILFFLKKRKLKDSNINDMKVTLINILNEIDKRVEFMQSNNDSIRTFIDENSMNYDDLAKLIDNVLYGVNQGCININCFDSRLKVSAYGRRYNVNVNMDNTLFIFQSTSGIFKEIRKL